MVDELVSVLEREVEIVGGYPIGTRRGYANGHGLHSYSAAGYAVTWAPLTSGVADVQLQPWGSPDEDRRPVVTSVMFDTANEARAEFERIKALLFTRQWVEWVTTDLAKAGIVPDEFREQLLAGELQALLVAADWQDDRDNPNAALLLRAAYHGLRGEVNVVVPAGKGRTIVLNPLEITKRTKVEPGIAPPRVAVIDAGKSVRTVAVRTTHESRLDPSAAGRRVTVVTTFVDERIFRVGDVAEYDSFNLVYFAPIEAITAKTVVIAGRHGKGKSRLTIARFVGKNHDFDLAKAQERNANWSD